MTPRREAPKTKIRKRENMNTETKTRIMRTYREFLGDKYFIEGCSAVPGHLAQMVFDEVVPHHGF